MTILLAEAFALHAPMLRDCLDDCGHSFADAVLLGATISKETYQAALEQRIALTASLDACMQDDDLLIAPIQAGEAPFLSDLSPWGFLQRPSYGIPFNLSNMPALSLCCGYGPNGLPLALQLIAARGNDVQVLDAAYGFQMRTDWHIRHR
jgi:Asp-tRNA(Asn)/Glu-tRNA(Gln) amidotransferase A subunit family amidase